MSESIKKSNTYNRDRNETEFDTLTKAVALKRRVAKYVMNEKHVPKRWRYVEGIQAVDYTRKIRDCIAHANDLDVGDPEREKYQNFALSYCNILQLQLDDIIEECQGATHTNMAPTVDELAELIRMIVSWQKSDKER